MKQASLTRIKEFIVIVGDGAEVPAFGNHKRELLTATP